MFKILRVIFSIWDIFNVFMHITYHPTDSTDAEQYATNQQIVQEEWKAKADAMDDAYKSQNQQNEG